MQMFYYIASDSAINYLTDIPNFREILFSKSQIHSSYIQGIHTNYIFIMQTVRQRMQGTLRIIAEFVGYFALTTDQSFDTF